MSLTELFSLDNAHLVALVIFPLGFMAHVLVSSGSLGRVFHIIMFATAIFSLVIGISLIIYKSFNSVSTSEAVCNSLFGNYRLLLDYIYYDKNDIRVIATDGEWRTTLCEGGKKGIFSLKGDDRTEQKIELKINGVYRQVAISETKYQSIITIGTDGRLIKRRIVNPVGGRPKITKREDNRLDEYQNLIADKLLEYEEIIDKKHSNPETSVCYPTLGKDDGRTFMALICSDYARILVKYD